jgi:dipeptidyl aminopeptidase/acylaminoacyl peptidase
MKWTPDGFRRSTRGWLWQKELELVLRSADSDEVRTIPVPLNTLLWQYQWDSRTILAWGQLRGEPRLLKIDLVTGQSSPYQDAELETSYGPGDVGEPATVAVTFSPDRRVKYFRRENGASFELVARDLSTGSERVLYRAPQQNFGGFEPSPDGRYIVFRVRQPELGDELRVVPTSGESSWVAYHAPAGRVIGSASFNWAPDSRTIVFAENSATPAAPTYWKVGVDGTGARALFSGPPAPSGVPHLHPDGKRIVFNSAFQSNEPVTELWVLENLVETRSSARR